MRSGGLLKIVAWTEVLVAIVLLIGAVFPFSGYCSGRAVGLDCESRAILGLNVLAPLALLLVACATWSMKTRSPKPQYALIPGIGAVVAYWLWHAA